VKTGVTLDGASPQLTASGVASLIANNLKGGPLWLNGQSSGKRVPGVVHFLNAKGDL
jgi:hypothetical protein